MQFHEFALSSRQALVILGFGVSGEEDIRVPLRFVPSLPLHHAAEDRHRPSPVLAPSPLALSAIHHAFAVYPVIHRGTNGVQPGPEVRWGLVSEAFEVVFIVHSVAMF